MAFAEAAKRVGYADPADVDDYLQQGSNAFLGADYEAAIRIFRALIPPICEAEIYLGQHEMVDEVLGVDLTTCAAQYVVAVYISAEAVRAAIDEVGEACPKKAHRRQALLHVILGGLEPACLLPSHPKRA